MPVSITYNGEIFDYQNPTTEMFSWETIAHVSFKIPRWNGHLRDGFDWMLGHHSILVRELLLKAYPEHADQSFEALMHDAGVETFFGDMPGPLKRLLGESYKTLERRAEQVFASKAGLAYPWHPIIKTCDLLAQDIEACHGIAPVPERTRILSDGFILEPWHEDLVGTIYSMDKRDFLTLIEDELKARHLSLSSDCTRTASAVPALA